jgi:catechol 2,3-dioxygenase-like lactoylglutathione lyase family enzyme
MEQTISNLLKSYEEGKVTRRQLVGGLAMLAAGSAPGLAAPVPGAIKAVSVNHIAINVSDLKKSTAWYKDVFGLTVGLETDKESALRFGDCGLIIRPSQQKPGTITHFMLGINGYDAEGLSAHLKSFGLEPRKDQDSFHVKDPDGLDVQVGDKDMRGASQAPPGSQHLTPKK